MAETEHVVIEGDVMDGLAMIGDESIDCCITSPPYYGLRNYGIGEWVGGDPECEHDTIKSRRGRGGSGTNPKEARFPDSHPAPSCSKCGAVFVSSEVGSETTPEAYVERLVEAFRGVRGALRPSGTLWLVIGDCYSGSGKGPSGRTGIQGQEGRQGFSSRLTRVVGLKNKDLIGVPWMTAFALRDDGWWLRSENIWHKPNHKPESVRDRPTRAHEQVFQLTKSARCYYDLDATRIPLKTKPRVRNAGGEPRCIRGGSQFSEGKRVWGDPKGRQRDTVWTVHLASKSYGGHVAPFPEDLVEPLILSSCPLDGWVLDPFAGSGTVAAVAKRLGRNSVSIELRHDYAQGIVERLYG